MGLAEKYWYLAGSHELRRKWQAAIPVSTAAWRAWALLPADTPEKAAAWDEWMARIDEQNAAFDAWEASKRPGVRDAV